MEGVVTEAAGQAVSAVLSDPNFDAFHIVLLVLFVAEALRGIYERREARREARDVATEQAKVLREQTDLLTKLTIMVEMLGGGGRAS